METDFLIENDVESMARADVRYQAVPCTNGTIETVNNITSTDDEMLDITTQAPFSYTDLADKSQGKL